MRYRAAVVQMTSTPDVERSLEAAEAGVQEAAASGARLVCLPENVSYLGPEADKPALAEPLDGPSFTRLARLARTHRVYLLAGTLPERSEDPGRPYNTSVLFGPAGQRLAVYRKIHLFDVDLGPDGPRFRESSRVSPGSGAVTVETELGALGLSVCYDLRFPELYRALVAAGADLLLVPSAFTVPTGKDHWEVLLRARAIENQCYVLAPAQQGHHFEKRTSYGRSLIVDPWGTVLTSCPDRPAVGLADVDLEALRQTRRRMPCLEHRRPERLGRSEENGSPGPHRADDLSS